MSRESMKLVDCQTTGLFCSFRRPFHRDECHRVALHWRIPAPHRVVPKKTEDAPDVNSAFWGKAQRIQPQFHRSCLDIGEQKLSPLWNNVIFQPNLIGSTGVSAFWHLFVSILLHQLVNSKDLLFGRKPEVSPNCLDLSQRIRLGWKLC